jgi:hypothetical protein
MYYLARSNPLTKSLLEGCHLPVYINALNIFCHKVVHSSSHVIISRHGTTPPFCFDFSSSETHVCKMGMLSSFDNQFLLLESIAVIHFVDPCFL